MEITTWFLFLATVFILYLVSYLAKSIFFSAIATIMLVIVSFFALALGLQVYDGSISEVVGTTETITYTYAEIELAGIQIANVVGVGGLLLGLYFIASLTMRLFGGGH